MSSSAKYSAGKKLGGRYTLLTPIAQGGMGEVWKARDQVTGRMVAAKVLRQEFSGEELSLSRLRIEANNAMRIQHPNIANVQDSGEQDGRGWIVMELVEGKPLNHYLKDGHRIATQDLVPVLMQVAMALGAASEAGVVHRDIKPANILVRPDGIVKLTDFGISRSNNQAALTAAGMVMGTAQYLPPEQAMGETATSLGDLYALGVIAYEAAAGRRPFTGKTQVDIAFSHVNDPVPPLPSDVPRPLADVICHLLEKKPEKRPDSGVALVRELSNAAKQMGISVATHPLPDPFPEAKMEPTQVHPSPVAAPVRHTKRRSLPEELLERPAGLDTPTDPQNLTQQSDSQDPQHVNSQTEHSQSLSGDAMPSNKGDADLDPTAVRRRQLSERLKERARVREEADTAHASASPTLPPPPAPTDKRSATDSAKRSGTQAIASSPQTKTRQQKLSSPPPKRVRPKPSSQASGQVWYSVSKRNTPPVSTLPPTPTQYNRSVVAPPVSKGRRITQAIIIALIIIAILAGAYFILQHMFGSLTSLLSDGLPTTKEVQTWQTPWAAV